MAPKNSVVKSRSDTIDMRSDGCRLELSQAPDGIQGSREPVRTQDGGGPMLYRKLHAVYGVWIVQREGLR